MKKKKKLELILYHSKCKKYHNRVIFSEKIEKGRNRCTRLSLSPTYISSLLIRNHFSNANATVLWSFPSGNYALSTCSLFLLDARIPRYESYISIMERSVLSNSRERKKFFFFLIIIALTIGKERNNGEFADSIWNLRRHAWKANFDHVLRVFREKEIPFRGTITRPVLPNCALFPILTTPPTFYHCFREKLPLVESMFHSLQAFHPDRTCDKIGFRSILRYAFRKLPLLEQDNRHQLRSFESLEIDGCLQDKLRQIYLSFNLHGKYLTNFGMKRNRGENILETSLPLIEDREHDRGDREWDMWCAVKLPLGKGKKRKKEFLNDGNFSTSRIMAFPTLFVPSFIVNTTRCIYLFFFGERKSRPTLTRTTQRWNVGSIHHPLIITHLAPLEFSTINFVETTASMFERNVSNYIFSQSALYLHQFTMLIHRPNSNFNNEIFYQIKLKRTRS